MDNKTLVYWLLVLLLGGLALWFIGGTHPRSHFTEQSQFGSGHTIPIAWGDFDHDGDLDAAIGNEHSPTENYLYVNNTNNEDYLILHLVGHRHDRGSGYSNRDGMGAKAFFYERGHLGEQDHLLGFREVSATGGFSSQNSLDVHFGLPKDEAVDIRIIWPGSDQKYIVQDLTSVARGQRLTIHENGPMTSRVAQGETERPPTAPSTSGVSRFFETFFLEYVQRDPEWSSDLRLFGNAPDPTGDRLTDISVETQKRNFEFIREGLAELRGYDRLSQSPEQLLATDILDWYLDDLLRGEQFMFHDYPVNQLFGVQNQMIAFMTDTHLVRTRLDAENYVKRLSQIGRKFDQLMDGLRVREEKGVIPPRIIVERALAGMRDFVGGTAQENPLYTSFVSKLQGLKNLSAEDQNALTEAALREVGQTVIPAYQRLISYVEHWQTIASEEVGIWHLPDGDSYYAYLLRHHTTTDLTPEEIHQLGLKEVARIQAEMGVIFDSVGFQGVTFGDRVRSYRAATRSDSRFLYPDTPEGHSQVLADYLAIIHEAEQNVASLFDVLPKARVRVEAVPEYLQGGTPGAYYQPPSLDGSRLDRSTR